MTRHLDDDKKDEIISSLKSEINYREGMELTHGSGNYARPPYENYKIGKLRQKLNDYRGSAHSPGEARKESMDLYGYSVKNAMHTIRLLSMGIELLEEGCLYPDRRDRDAETLKEIKRGEWTLEQVSSHARNLYDKASQAHKKAS